MKRFIYNYICFLVNQRSNYGPAEPLQQMSCLSIKRVAGDNSGSSVLYLLQSFQLSYPTIPRNRVTITAVELNSTQTHTS